MKGVQCYEIFGGIALKNHAFLYDRCFTQNLNDVCSLSFTCFNYFFVCQIYIYAINVYTIAVCINLNYVRLPIFARLMYFNTYDIFSYDECLYKTIVLHDS